MKSKKGNTLLLVHARLPYPTHMLLTAAIRWPSCTSTYPLPFPCTTQQLRYTHQSSVYSASMMYSTHMTNMIALCRVVNTLSVIPLLRILSTVVALPVSTLLVCFLQAIYIAGTVPKLKEATDDIRSTVTETSTTSGDGSKVSEYYLDMLVIGDSLASGVGHQSHKTAIAGQVARQLLQQIHAYRVQQQKQRAGTNSNDKQKAALRTTVNWQALARTGYTASRMLQMLVPCIAWEKHVQQYANESCIPQPNQTALSVLSERDVVQSISSTDPTHHQLVLLSNGVNEVFWLSSIASYKRHLVKLLTAVRQASTSDVSIAIAGIPDLKEFPAFKPPLRWLVSLRSQQICQATEEVVQELNWPNLVYCSFGTGERYGVSVTAADIDTDFFTIDGVHPAARGCEMLARLTVLPALGHLKYSLKLADEAGTTTYRDTDWDDQLLMKQKTSATHTDAVLGAGQSLPGVFLSAVSKVFMSPFSYNYLYMR